MNNIEMNKFPLFDISIDYFEYANHEDAKPILSKVINDISTKYPNLNVDHSLPIYESISALHNNVAFSNFISSEQISLLGKEIRKKINLNPSYDLSFIDLKFFIIPPQLTTQITKGIGAYQGYYFLHSMPESGFLNIKHPIDSDYFTKIANKPYNQFNAGHQTINTPEGGVYVFPSYLYHNFTQNFSSEPKVVISFSLDITES